MTLTHDMCTHDMCTHDMCRVRRGHVCACHERPLYCDYTGDFECLKRKMVIKKVVYKESFLCGMRPSCDGVFGCGV